MHLPTARQQWHITKCNYWTWVTKASRVPSCHHIFTRTAHTERYNHRALCSALLHSHSQPELSGIVTFALSFIAICPHWIYCEILGFFFQRSFSCKSFWCTAAAVHDVMHFVQHWNHPCWRWCWLMIMCGGCFGGVSRSRRCCLQVSAESATTETTSLVLMPCSTEHSGDRQQRVKRWLQDLRRRDPRDFRPAHKPTWGRGPLGLSACPENSSWSGEMLSISGI